MAGTWALFPNAYSDPASPLTLFGIASVLVLVSASLYAQAWRYRHHSPPLQQLQTKWFVFALAASLGITALLLLTPLLAQNPQLAADASVWGDLGTMASVLVLGIVPIAIGIAILRHQLWQIDILIRRTIVYAPLTAILAGLVAASIKVTQGLFGGLAGAQSETGTVLTTPIVVAAFDPIKSWLQKSVDARFKEASNPKERWKTYLEQVRTSVEIHDPLSSAERLLEEAVAVFEAKGGTVGLGHLGEMQPVHSIGDWQAPAVTVPLEHQGVVLGQLLLAERRSGRPYEPRDQASLMEHAQAVAAAIALAGRKAT